MRDNRKSVKATPAVKAELEALKKELNLSSESEVLAYLQIMYRNIKGNKINLTDHQKFLKHAKEVNQQTSF